jgi:hypothetical protein
MATGHAMANLEENAKGWTAGILSKTEKSRLALAPIPSGCEINDINAWIESDLLLAGEVFAFPGKRGHDTA